MIVRQVHTPFGLLAILAQPSTEMQALRQQLTLPGGRFACRRTWERRLAAIPETSLSIACLGGFLLVRLALWTQAACAAAIDSTVLVARGGVWHKKIVKPNSCLILPLTPKPIGRIGLARLGLWLEIAPHCKCRLPCMASICSRGHFCQRGDNEQAPALIENLPPGTHFSLGDQHYYDKALFDLCGQQGTVLVTSHTGRIIRIPTMMLG